MRKIKRGQIYLYDFKSQDGSKQSGFRPIIILQNDAITAHSSEVLVAPLTGKIKNPYWYPHVYLGKNYGLDVPSMVLCEQITPIEKSKLKYYIGEVNEPKIISVLNNTVKRVLGIQEADPKITNDIRCLCGKHREEYFLTGNYILRRFNPYQVVKERCDKCDSLGYDYLLLDKRLALRRGGRKNG